MRIGLSKKQTGRKNNQSIRRTWILLFGIFILIALLLMSMYFSNINTIISENLKEYNLAKIGQTKGTLDLAIANLTSVADSVASDENISGFDASYNFEKNRQIIRELNQHMEKDSAIFSIMLLCSENGSVMNNMGTAEEEIFYAANFSEEFSREKWKSLFYKNDFYGYIELPMIEDGKRVVNRLAYIRPSERFGGNVIVVLNNSNVLEPDPYFYKVMITNKSGESFLVSGTEDEKVNIDYEKLRKSMGIYEDSDNNYISYADGAIRGLKYILFTDKDIFMKNLGETKSLTFFYLTVYFIIGILLAFRFSKKQYEPIKSIAEQLGVGANTGEKNEYNVIKNGIAVMLKETSSYSREIERSKQFFKEQSVINLLKGKQLRKDEIPEIDGKKSMIIKVLWNQLQSDELNYSDMIGYALKNMAEEIFSELGDVYCAEIDDSVVSLVFFDNADNEKNFRKYSLRFIEVIKKHLELDVEIVLSRMAESGNDIAAIYDEVTEATQLCGLQKEKIITASDVAERNHSDYSYSLKTEMKIISFIKNGDSDGAIALINDKLNEMLYDRNLSIYMLRCFMINLEATILKALDEIEYENNVKMPEEFLNINEMFRCSSIAGMQKIVCENLRVVSRFVLQNNSQYGSELCEEIRQYIRANFQNPDLNVNQVAKGIHMNSSYVSSVFKKNTGMRLLEYINLIRIEEAKKLMLQKPDLKMEMVAEMTGFSNIRTFRRVFEKYETVAPSKYAKN